MANNNTVVVIEDTVAKNYTAPMTFANDAAAQRYFQNAANKQENIGDFKMWKVAEYDYEQGIIIPVSQELLAKGDDYVKKNA